LRLAAEVGAYITSHGRLPPLLGGFRTRLKRWLGQPENLPEYPAWLDRGLEERFDLRARWEALNRAPAPVHPFRPRAYQPLAGEPVVELWRRKPCHAETLLAGTPELTCYIDPRRLSPVQPERDPESVWLALRPISLSLWLRTTRNLQYKKYPEEGNEGIQSVDPEKTLSHAATGRVRKSC